MCPPGHLPSARELARPPDYARALQRQRAGPAAHARAHARAPARPPTLAHPRPATRHPLASPRARLTAHRPPACRFARAPDLSVSPRAHARTHVRAPSRPLRSRSPATHHLLASVRARLTTHRPRAGARCSTSAPALPPKRGRTPARPPGHPHLLARARPPASARPRPATRHPLATRVVSPCARCQPTRAPSVTVALALRPAPRPARAGRGPPCTAAAAGQMSLRLLVFTSAGESEP
jgi:hypothetical protein